jgi:hypothetical protein
LKRIHLEEKPLEDEDFLGVPILSCDEKRGEQKHDDISRKFLVGKHRWDMDCWFFHGDPIYDTNNEILMARGADLHLPFPISLEDNFMRYGKNYSYFVSLDLGQLKDVEVDGALSIVVAQYPFHFSRKRDLLFYKKCYHKMTVRKEIFQPIASSACSLLCTKIH